MEKANRFWGSWKGLLNAAVAVVVGAVLVASYVSWAGINVSGGIVAVGLVLGVFLIGSNIGKRR